MNSATEKGQNSAIQARLQELGLTEAFLANVDIIVHTNPDGTSRVEVKERQLRFPRPPVMPTESTVEQRREWMSSMLSWMQEAERLALEHDARRAAAHQETLNQIAPTWLALHLAGFPADFSASVEENTDGSLVPAGVPLVPYAPVNTEHPGYAVGSSVGVGKLEWYEPVGPRLNDQAASVAVQRTLKPTKEAQLLGAILEEPTPPAPEMSVFLRDLKRPVGSATLAR